MQSFDFKCPTEVVFGRHAEDSIAQKLRAYGATKVFIVYGGGSVVRSGLLAHIERLLTEGGLAFEVRGGVQPNPRVGLVRKCILEAVSCGADFVLGIGGGSVIDSAKAIAHGAANPDVDIWDFWTGAVKLEKTLPIATVLTLAAAGSETSDSAVLTNEDTGKKQGLNTQLNRPVISFLNPELAMSAPIHQIICGLCDIYMHTLERYFTDVKEPNLFTDRVAESLLRTLIEVAPVITADPHNYDAMSEIMWCGSVSHCNFTELGRHKDFSVHRLGHELGGRFDVTHGESLTALWGSWASYMYKDDVDRFAHYAEAVWGVTAGSPEERAQAGIKKTVEFFHSLKMPTCFSELSIGVQPAGVIDELADMLTAGDTKKIGCFHPIDKATAVEIYHLANH